MNSLIALVLLFLVVVVTLGIVTGIGLPIVQSATKTTDIRNAEADLKFINSLIRSVAQEGKDATRVYKFTSPKDFKSIPGEDAVQFSTESRISFIDYLTRTFTGNFVYVSGNDVDCVEETEKYVAENDRIKAVFRKISGQIDTGSILVEITQKDSNEKINIGDSSITINGNASTSAGTGFTEISNTGRNLPVCQIHAFVDGTADYDIYYRLYAGADFIVVEVRNIS